MITTSRETDPVSPTRRTRPVVEVDALTKRFGSFTALEDVGFTIEENTICGLLGRNGAGKSTIMRLLTGQDFVRTGDVRVFGERPAENASVLDRLCFIKEARGTRTTSGRGTSSPPRRGSSRTGTPTSPSGSSTTSGSP